LTDATDSLEEMKEVMNFGVGLFSMLNGFGNDGENNHVFVG
jgi:hypothetical protein